MRNVDQKKKQLKKVLAKKNNSKNLENNDCKEKKTKKDARTEKKV